MIKVNYSTAKGKQLYARACNWEGNNLAQVYDHWSIAKERAYNWCVDEYYASEDHDSFGICSHNSFMFTCSWLCTIDGEDVLRYETPEHTYLIYLNR